MDTLMASSEPDEPQRERTEAEKIAQYRTDYRASLDAVGKVLGKQARQVKAVPALVNQAILKAS